MTDLEKEGIAFIKKYGYVLRMHLPLKAFFIKVGEAMGWEEFGKLL